MADSKTAAGMGRHRLEAFSDGVIAILITIMILELKTPQGADLAALGTVVPTLLTYVLSFVYLGIYWNNHHHMLHMTEHVNGAILWANLHLLFWLSLVPFVTSWMGNTHLAPLPTAVYGLVFLLAAVAYTILQATIIALQGPGSKLAAAVKRDVKGKASLVLYTVAVAVSFVNQWIAASIYVICALMWLVPDRRIEATVGH
jgi:uncharacterized membrane protein